MNKYLLLLLFAGVVNLATGQSAGPKLSPVTRKYISEYRELKATGGLPSGYAYKKAGKTVYAGALIKVSDAIQAQQGLTGIDAMVGTKAGNIWTVKVPVEYIEEFIQLPGIVYIQLDELVKPELNIALSTTRVDSVHKGIGLNMPYTGKNVVIGIIDFGFDYNHPAFMDTTGQNCRIRKVWELNTNGTPPAGFSYGHELSTTSDILAHTTDNPLQTHGSGVAGLAAGSGFGSLNNKKFRGVAFESELVFVGVRRDSIASQWMQGGFSDFVDGISYIFNYANSVEKPAVVNISWGSQSGSHDGTSLFNQACDNLAGMGKIIVMSGGNDGQDEIHLSKQFTANDTALHTFLSFAPAHYQRTWVDAWGQKGKTFCINTTLYNNGIAGASTGKTCIDDQTHEFFLLGSNGTDTCRVEVFTSASEQNEKPRVTISIFNKTSDSIGISFTGNDGLIHVWDEYYYYGYEHGFKSTFVNNGNSWAEKGNTTSTVSDMGSAQSVLLVGAYTSKTGYTDINGNPWSYSGYAVTGRITPFSSLGPLTDGRIKPDIAAPGLTIATSVNSYDTAYSATGTSSKQVVLLYTHPVTGRKYYYGEFTGTSASAPIASGIVALMLQANPYMEPADIKKILAETAIQDFGTGTIPPQGNNTWGHGKINAYKAVKRSLEKVGIYSFAGQEPNCLLYPNPNNGQFTLEIFDENVTELTIQVFNINGSLVSSSEWTKQSGTSTYEMKLTELPAGLYIVRVTSAFGSTSIKTVIR